MEGLNITKEIPSFEQFIEKRIKEAKRGYSLDNLELASEKVGISLGDVTTEFIGFIFDNDPIENKDKLAEYVDTIDKLEQVQTKLGKMISDMTWI